MSPGITQGEPPPRFQRIAAAAPAGRNRGTATKPATRGKPPVKADDPTAYAPAKERQN